MTELREITQEEYRNNMRNELRNTNLLTAVKKRCDDINEVCGCLSYVQHGYVQELLVEIIDLIELDGGKDT